MIDKEAWETARLRGPSKGRGVVGIGVWKDDRWRAEVGIGEVDNVEGICYLPSFC